PGLAAAQTLRRSVSAAELRALQNQADAACRCARTSGQGYGSPCWRGYQRSLASFETYASAASCTQEAMASDCIGRLDMDVDVDAPGACIVTQRPYGACSAEEYRARQAAARARHQSGCSD